MSKRRLKRLLAVFIGLFFATSGSAYCLNISPTRIEISVAASKSYEGTLMVKNADKNTIQVKLRTEDWRKAVEGVRRERASAAMTWLEMNPLGFDLKEGETKEVGFRVKIPKKAEGEFNAMIFIDSKPKEVKEGAIGINTSVGIPIYVMVKGTEHFKAEVEDLKIVKRIPLELAIKIKNSGNVHIRPTGSIEIKNKDGILLTVPLNEYNYPILPNSSRILEIKTNNRLEQGEYTADIKMGFSDRKWKKRTKLIVQ